MKSNLKWSKAIEIDLEYVNLSLDKDKRKAYHIYKVLSKIYQRMSEDNVVQKHGSKKTKTYFEG